MKAFWTISGGVALAFGTAGIVLPLLPTTPFVLLAAFCFSRSSPRFHRWILNHKHFGPIITDWRRGRAISRRTKINSSVLMTGTLIGGLALDFSWSVLAVQAVILMFAFAFIVTRPSPPN